MCFTSALPLTNHEVTLVFQAQVAQDYSCPGIGSMKENDNKFQEYFE
ncbi:1952_t:CDS:2, partial [Gigaspora rosea]